MKTLLLILISFITFQTIFSQEKREVIYLDSNHNECRKRKAFYVVEFHYSNFEIRAGKATIKTLSDSSVTIREGIGITTSDIIDGTITTYYNEKSIKSILIYKNGKLNGQSKKYYINGNLKEEAVYKNGNLSGILKTFYDSGNIRRIENHDNGNFVSGTCYNISGEETDFFVLEELPAFPGGEQGLILFLNQNVKYPEQALNNNIQGIARVGFVIDKSGAIKNIRIVNEIDKILARAAIRVIEKMPKWKPGKYDGEVCERDMVLPITYRLN